MVEYPQYMTGDKIVTTREMAAVVHRRPCLQHIACCSVNSRHIGSESRFLPIHLHSTPPLGGFPSEYRHPVWYGKTRMVCGCPTVKNFEDIFIRFDTTYERDRHTDTAWRHRPRLCIASRGKNGKFDPPVNTKWLFKRRPEYVITSRSWVVVQNLSKIGSPNFAGGIGEL